MKAAVPVVGIDLDNTLVSYDRLFHRLALEQGLIPPDLAVNKTVVRDFLRSVDREPAWTALQGLAYGSRLREAEAFAGALDFIREGNRRSWQMHIVSHKTKHPILGEPVDLHEAARGWLEANDVHGEAGLPRANVWFEVTKATKIERIRELGCRIFIDDLPELLNDPKFPSGTKRILFAPPGSGVKNDRADLFIASSWPEITRFVSHELA